MATIKSFTDISQSKTLSKILPLESADMCYRIVAYNPDNTHVYQPYCFVGTLESDVPCWSLAALLGVLPEGTRLLKSDNTYHCDCPKENIDKWFDNPIDACVAMIESLHELKML